MFSSILNASIDDENVRGRHRILLWMGLGDDNHATHVMIAARILQDPSAVALMDFAATDTMVMLECTCGRPLRRACMTL